MPDCQQLDVTRATTYTVRTWIKLWYEVYAEPRLQEKTKDYYLNYIENHIIPKLEDIRLDKLTTIQIQKFYNDLQKNGRVQRYKHIELKNKGLSVRVVRGIHTLLNNCLEQAAKERLLLVNPARGCKLPKMEKKKMKVLPQEKIGPYLSEAEKRGLLAAYYLELTTGLRRGELLALLWTDLDVEARTISVTKQVNRIKGELVVSQPKTQNSVRVLPVSQQAVNLMVEEHKKHPGNPYMFPPPKTGGMFDPDSFRHTHDKILKAIGAEHIRFHDLRHTFATLSLKNGVDVKPPVRCPGPLLGGIHPEYLYPCHTGDDAGGDGYDGECDWAGYIESTKKMAKILHGRIIKKQRKAKKNQHRAGKNLPGAALFYPELSPYWSAYWSKPRLRQNQAEPGLFEGKSCSRDSNLNRNDCQVFLPNSGNLLCTTPTPSDGGEVYKQDEY